MKKLKKLMALALGTCVLVIGSGMQSAEASKLDAYRNMLIKKTYSIKFKDITPAPRTTNKDVVKMYGKNSMDTSQSYFMLYKQSEGYITSEGDNRYEEIGFGDIKQCRFQRGEDTFVFVKQQTQKNNNPLLEIFGGSKKNVIVPTQTNFLASFMQGMSFGSDGLTRYLNAILPDDYKSKDMPEFTFVKAGQLDGGLNYEDYKSHDGAVDDIVRYYFKGNALCKIAAMKYWRNTAGVMEGSKTIIRIDEFVPTANKEMLTLPPGVKEGSKGKGK